MSDNLVATEEIRDCIHELGGNPTVTSLAAELVVSESTVRRHLRVLTERGWVIPEPPSARSHATRWKLTPRGQQAHDENEPL